MAPRVRASAHRLAAATAAAFLVLGLIGSTSAVAAPARVSIGYFGNYDIYSGYYPKNIAATEYTHINYAFANVTASGNCAINDPAADYKQPYGAANAVNGHADGASQKLRGNFNQFKQLKAANPGLKVFISLGGASAVARDHFSTLAKTVAGRQKFVTSCINLFLKGNLPVSGTAGGTGVAKGVFDGIDVDWEFPVYREPGPPVPADRHNATLLFQEFRRQLNTYGNSIGKHFLLTAAIPPGQEANDRYEIATVAQSLDWMNLMTYDMHGGWDATTDFDSPFQYDPADSTTGSTQFTVKGTTQILIGQGVPASKIVLGVPFYGYEYKNVAEGGSDPTNHGLYSPFSGGATGDHTYRSLVNQRQIVSATANPTGLNGYTRYVRTQAGGEPWLWNPSVDGGTFITYEDAASIARRVTYVKANGLRGLMAWEVSQDDAGNHLSAAMGAVAP